MPAQLRLKLQALDPLQALAPWLLVHVEEAAVQLA